MLTGGRVASACILLVVSETATSCLRDCFRKCVEMGDLLERYIFQLVGTTLVVMPVTVQVPLVPHLEPLCEEVIDHCGCPIQGTSWWLCRQCDLAVC